MKSYLQGMITGGVLVFATILFMGANKDGEVGRYIYYNFDTNNSSSYMIFDTKTGKGITYLGHVRKDKSIRKQLAEYSYDALVFQLEEQYSKKDKK